MCTFFRQKLTTALLESAENDCRKYFMINLHERMLPTLAGVNPRPPGPQSDGASNWATEARNNPTITAFVCFQKFPCTFKALCLLLLSEQMKNPPSANLSQVQTLFQNCLHTAFWYASTTSYISDRQSRILFDHNLYSSDVSLGNRGFRPSRTGININRKFPSFKSFNPPKNCAHWNGLRSIYTTQFIKYLLWIYIKPNAAFNIAMNFSLLVHVPM